MSLPPSFYEHFEDRLNLAVTDINMGFKRFQPGSLHNRPFSFRDRHMPEEILPRVAFFTDPTIEISMSITGAANLAGTIKERIEAAKAKVAQVSQNTDNALAKLNAAADHGDRIAKQIETEADDLVAQIGQFSNMPPP